MQHLMMLDDHLEVFQQEAIPVLRQLLQLEYCMNDSVDQIPVVTPLEKEELLNSFNPSVNDWAHEIQVVLL